MAKSLLRSVNEDEHQNNLLYVSGNEHDYSGIPPIHVDNNTNEISFSANECDAITALSSGVNYLSGGIDDVSASLTSFIQNNYNTFTADTLPDVYVTKNSFNSFVDTTNNSITAIINDVSDLNGEINTINDALNDLSTDISDLQISADNIQEELYNAVENIGTLSSTVSGLSDDVEVLKDNTNTISGNLETLSDTVEEHTDSINNIDNELTAISGVIDELDDRIDIISDNLETLDDTVESIASAVNDINDEIIDLNNSTAQIRTDLDYLDDTFKSFSTVVSSELDGKINYSDLIYNAELNPTAVTGISVYDTNYPIDIPGVTKNIYMWDGISPNPIELNTSAGNDNSRIIPFASADNQDLGISGTPGVISKDDKSKLDNIVIYNSDSANMQLTYVGYNNDTSASTFLGYSGDSLGFYDLNNHTIEEAIATPSIMEDENNWSEHPFGLTPEQNNTLNTLMTILSTSSEHPNAIIGVTAINGVPTLGWIDLN
jgi:predicted  nucleic acid-binding Zn-ribbon protein